MRPKPRLSQQPEGEQVTQRLQKVLAQAGLGSRRDMEELIKSGQVIVNNEVATIGMSVGPADRVRVGKRVIHLKFSDRLPRVVLYHKQSGEIVSRDDPQKRVSVFDKLPEHMRSSKWIAVGRLDYNTEGLLIFTTSGDLANRLMHPRFEVEREYAVRLMGQLSDEQMKLLTTGIPLEDGEAKFDYIRDEGGDSEASNHWYRVILKEGRNREVRRMFQAVHLMVTRLIRVRFGIINLPPRVKRGQLLELEEAQIIQLLEWAQAVPGMEESDIEPLEKAEPKQKQPARQSRRNAASKSREATSPYTREATPSPMPRRRSRGA